MTVKRLFIGKTGEDIAVEFLKKQGYRIIERNFKSKLGELDIIASDKDTICFIEVKTRTSLEKGSGFESITRTKQHKLSKTALCYLKMHQLLKKPARFDVVSILLDGSLNKPSSIPGLSLDSARDGSRGMVSEVEPKAGVLQKGNTQAATSYPHPEGCGFQAAEYNIELIKNAFSLDICYSY